MDKDLPFWLALNEFPRFGPISFAKLYSFFPSMEAAFHASAQQLVQAGISQKDAERFCFQRENISPQHILERLQKHGIRAIRRIDEDYPELLKTIYDPPAILYVYGTLPSSEIAHVAVVGSRKSSSYGLISTQMLVEPLAAAGVVIVSGLAYGIDEAAHKATLRAKGTTIAVLASGLLKLTSRQQYLVEEIIKNGGAVISEFPPETAALRHHFPIRNRIVSGLSHGTLVIEAMERSGSLITAKVALEQNREVFAVPGPINSPQSEGTNNLIKMGAHPATTPSDILDILEVEQAPIFVETPSPDTKEESALYMHLSKSPIHVDELIRRTQFSSSTVIQTLSLMEMKGRIRQIGGMYYILI